MSNVLNSNTRKFDDKKCPTALTHARCEDAVGPGAAAVLARVARARVVTQRALTVLAVVITAPALVAKLRPREEEALQ